MAPLARRLIPTVVITLIFLLVLSALYHRSFVYPASQSPFTEQLTQPPLQEFSESIPATPSSLPVATSTEDRFSWRDVSIRHPVESLVSLPQGRPESLRRIQYAFGTESASEKSLRLERQASVKRVFEKCFASYKERAWLEDELSPISGHGQNFFGGWAATLVDALDTLWIMGMHDGLKDAIAGVATIDFSTSTDTEVNIFETTIRYLGGFLSAYDLTGDETLLRKAIEVGEMLLVAFDTPNHMPSLRWDWQAAARGDPQVATEHALVSELGSLTLEFTRLSQITQDMRWYDAVARITNLFDAQQQTTRLPGMWPVSISAKRMILNDDNWFTLGGMSDSLYEYFPKAFALLGGKEPVYKKLYEGSISTAIQHLFYRPMTPDNQDILISGNVRAHSSGVVLDPQGQHLGCFSGGMLALAGRLFDSAEHITIGRKLTDGCIWAYNASRWGIMPETFHLVPCESKSSCQWDEKAWKDAVLKKNKGSSESVDSIIELQRLALGFTDIGDRRYILRPEAIESIFILYRITGDKTLQDSAWQMWTTISDITATEFANAAIVDVTAPEGSMHLNDRMESFWLAETLKYFYLIFSEPDLISLDQFVLNTEAHAFRRPV